MDIVRKQMSHKCFGTEGSKICNFDFYSNASNSSIHTSSNGQYGCPFIFSKDGGYPQQSFLRYKQRDLGLLAGQRDQITAEYFPGAHYKEADFQSLAVRDSSKWKLDFNFFQTICRKWEVPDISFCFQNFPSSRNIHIMEAGSIQQEKGRFSSNMDSPKRICFPPSCINRSSLEKKCKKKKRLCC